MNRISVNVTGAMARILEIARERANDVKPVAKVEVPTAVAYTVADQLDLDARTIGRTAIVKVVDYEGVKAQVNELRASASASMKRSYSAFLTALESSYAEAEANHATVLANDIAPMMNGARLEGRPVAQFSVEKLATLHNDIVEHLLLPSYLLTANYNNSSATFRPEGNRVSVDVLTSARFTAVEGVNIVDYRHQLNAEGILRTVQGVLTSENRVFVQRHNSDPNGAKRHIELFLAEAMRIIEWELELRATELASVGIDLEYKAEVIPA